MQYMGSKAKIAKHILPLMLKERKAGQCWVEPFVGGANIIDKVDGYRLGNDSHKYLIALLKATQEGWVPPVEVSKEMYYRIKKEPDKYSDFLVGFVGFLCSFGGKWFSCYAANSKGYNYAEAGSRIITQQAKKFSGINFTCSDYTKMYIPSKSLIYCDPPYANTTKYSTSHFDHDIFWEWCREREKEGHTVFISEYTSPEDFECIKKIEHKTILNKNKQDPRVEKLFRYLG